MNPEQNAMLIAKTAARICLEPSNTLLLNTFVLQLSTLAYHVDGLDKRIFDLEHSNYREGEGDEYSG